MATEITAIRRPPFGKWHSGDRNMWPNGHRNDLTSLAPYHRNEWHNMAEISGTMATELSKLTGLKFSWHGIEWFGRVSLPLDEFLDSFYLIFFPNTSSEKVDDLQRGVFLKKALTFSQLQPDYICHLSITHIMDFVALQVIQGK